MDGKDIPCCPDILHNDPSMLHPECAPIAIPTNDPFYAPFNQTCMEFVRSVPDSSCFLGKALSRSLALSLFLSLSRLLFLSLDRPLFLHLHLSPFSF